jgi:hypothetical protein
MNRGRLLAANEIEDDDEGRGRLEPQVSAYGVKFGLSYLALRAVGTRSRPNKLSSRGRAEGLSFPKMAKFQAWGEDP